MKTVKPANEGVVANSIVVGVIDIEGYMTSDATLGGIFADFVNCRGMVVKAEKREAG